MFKKRWWKPTKRNERPKTNSLRAFHGPSLFPWVEGVPLSLLPSSLLWILLSWCSPATAAPLQPEQSDIWVSRWQISRALGLTSQQADELVDEFFLKSSTQALAKHSICILKKSKSDSVPRCRLPVKNAKQETLQSLYFALDLNQPQVFFNLKLLKKRAVAKNEGMRALEFELLPRDVPSQAIIGQPTVWPEPPFPTELFVVPLKNMLPFKRFLDSKQWELYVQPEWDSYQKSSGVSSLTPDEVGWGLGMGFSLGYMHLTGLAMMYGIKDSLKFRTNRWEWHGSLRPLKDWWEPLGRVKFGVEWTPRVSKTFALLDSSNAGEVGRFTLSHLSLTSWLGWEFPWNGGIPMTVDLWLGRIWREKQSGSLKEEDNSIPFTLNTSAWIGKLEWSVYLLNTGLFTYTGSQYWIDSKTRLEMDGRKFVSTGNRYDLTLGFGWTSKPWSPFTKVHLQSLLAWKLQHQAITYPELGSQKFQSSWEPFLRLRLIY